LSASGGFESWPPVAAPSPASPSPLPAVATACQGLSISATPLALCPLRLEVASSPPALGLPADDRSCQRQPTVCARFGARTQAFLRNPVRSPSPSGVFVIGCELKSSRGGTIIRVGRVVPWSVGPGVGSNGPHGTDLGTGTRTGGWSPADGVLGLRGMLHDIGKGQCPTGHCSPHSDLPRGDSGRGFT